jgi:lipid-binding SYLF domain-containing protein
MIRTGFLLVELSATCISHRHPPAMIAFPRLVMENRRSLSFSFPPRHNPGMNTNGQIRMTKAALKFTALIAAAIFCTACSTTPKSQTDRDELHLQATTSFNTFQTQDPTLGVFMKNSYGYAIFPTIGKGGAGLGMAYGHAEVYEQGNFVGYADMTQGTIGLQLGGESFAELIVFQNKDALESFQSGDFEFAANASAVAATAGAGATAQYTDGVAVFVRVNGGLMAEAVIGGQKFAYAPLNPSDTPTASNVQNAPATPSAPVTPSATVTPPASVTPTATVTPTPTTAPSTMP